MPSPLAPKTAGRLAGAALAALAAAAAAGPAPPWPPFLEPRGAFPAEVIAAVERVWQAPTLTRTVRGRPARAPLAAYVLFVDVPEVTAAAARFRKLAPWEVEALGPGHYRADDRDGARGVYRVVRHEPTRRVILSWGEHASRLLGAIHGSALTVLDFEPQGDVIEQTVTAHVRIDNRLAAVLARLLVAVFGFVADRKLAQGFAATAQVAEWAAASPGEFCVWLAREPVAAPRRDRFVAVFPGCPPAPAPAPAVAAPRRPRRRRRRDVGTLEVHRWARAAGPARRASGRERPRGLGPAQLPQQSVGVGWMVGPDDLEPATR